MNWFLTTVIVIAAAIILILALQCMYYILGTYDVPEDITISPSERHTLNKWIESSVMKSAGSDAWVTKIAKILLGKGGMSLPGAQPDARRRMPHRVLIRMLKRKTPADKFRMELAINAARFGIVRYGVQEGSFVTIDNVVMAKIFDKYSMAHCNVLIKPNCKFEIRPKSTKTYFVISYAKEAKLEIYTSDTIGKELKVHDILGTTVNMQKNVYDTINAICDYAYMHTNGLPVWWDKLPGVTGKNIDLIWPAVANLHYISQPVLIVLPSIIDLGKESVLSFKSLFMRTWPNIERQCSLTSNKMYIIDTDVAKLCAVILCLIKQLMDSLECDKDYMIAKIFAVVYRLISNDPAVHTIMKLVDRINDLAYTNSSGLQPNIINKLTRKARTIGLNNLITINYATVREKLVDTEVGQSLVDKYEFVFRNIDTAKILIAELKDMVDIIEYANIIKTQSCNIYELINNKWAKDENMKSIRIGDYNKVLNIFSNKFTDKKSVHVVIINQEMNLIRTDGYNTSKEWKEIIPQKTNIRNFPFALLFKLDLGTVSDVYCQGDKFIAAAIYSNLHTCLKELYEVTKQNSHPFEFLMEGEIAVESWRNMDRQSAHGIPVIWKINTRQAKWPDHLKDSCTNKYCWPGFATTPNGSTMLRQAYAIFNMDKRKSNEHYIALQNDAVDHIVAIGYSTKESIHAATYMWIIYTGLFRKPLDAWRAQLGGNSDLLAVQIPVKPTNEHHVENFMMLNFVSTFLDDSMECLTIDGVKGYLTRTTKVDLSDGGHRSDNKLEPLFIVTEYYMIENTRKMMKKWLNELDKEHSYDKDEDSYDEDNYDKDENDTYMVLPNTYDKRTGDIISNKKEFKLNTINIERVPHLPDRTAISDMQVILCAKNALLDISRSIENNKPDSFTNALLDEAKNVTSISLYNNTARLLMEKWKRTIQSLGKDKISNINLINKLVSECDMLVTEYNTKVKN